MYNTHSHTHTQTQTKLICLFQSIIIVPPFFESSFGSQNIKPGEFFEINCEAGGEKPISLSWSKDRVSFNPNQTSRYKLIESNKKDKIVNILKVFSADRSDSALFTCIASNPFGKDEYNIQVILQGRPSVSRSEASFLLEAPKSAKKNITSFKKVTNQVNKLLFS